MLDNHFCPFFLLCAPDRTRTCTSKTPDPKSGASTNSATGAKERSVFRPKCPKWLQRYE